MIHKKPGDARSPQTNEDLTQTRHDVTHVCGLLFRWLKFGMLFFCWGTVSGWGDRAGEDKLTSYGLIIDIINVLVW